MAGEMENLLSDLKAEFKNVSDDVKRTAEDAMKQAKASGDVSAETKAAADKLLASQSDLSANLDAVNGKLEGVETRSREIEQEIANHGRGGAQAKKTVGQAFVESDAYAGFKTAGYSGTYRFDVKNVITSLDASAGAFIVDDWDTNIAGLPRRQMTIRDLITVGSTDSDLVITGRMTARTNAAAIVPHGALKPESNYTWEKLEAPVRTIAHWVPVHRQTMDDARQLSTEINGELAYGLALVEEAQVLTGDGLGDNLSGLVTEATAYSQVETGVTEPTLIDRLRLAILQLALADYNATGFVLNPTEWAGIEMTKDANNRYVFGDPHSMVGPMLWGKSVVSTNAMAAGSWLAGDFKLAATLYDRMATEILVSSEDRDNFIRNMLTVRAEKRLALAVKRPEALVTGNATFGI